MQRLADERDIHAVTTLAELNVAQRLFLAASNKDRHPWDSLMCPTVHVNHGRVLVDCPQCGAGVGVFRPARVAYCFGCGARFAELTWPDARLFAEVERVLLDRGAPYLQNWRPGQEVVEFRDTGFATMDAGSAPPRIIPVGNAQ